MKIYTNLLNKIKRTANKTLGNLAQEQGTTTGWSMIKQTKSVVQDDIVLLKGSAEYAKMYRDPDVKSAISTKAFGVVSKGYQITPAIGDNEPDYEQAKQQADFVEYVLDMMPGNLTDKIEEMLRDCMIYGTTISEKIWGWDKDYSVLMMSNIKVKEPILYEVEQDEYGNVLKLFVCTRGEKKEVDSSKFIRATYNAEHDNFWGESDMRAAYLYWFIKSKLVRWWAAYLEKFAVPPVKGSVPAGTTEAAKTELLNVLSSFQQETAIVIPDDVTVELMESSGKSSSEFAAALDYFGKQITKSILGQTLATEQNSNTGSLAQAKVHQDTLISYITKMKNMVETIINEQVIKDIIDYNFADRYYPQFILPLDEKDVQSLAQTIYQLVTCGEVQPGETWIREYLGLPEREKTAENNNTPEENNSTRPPRRIQTTENNQEE